MICGQGIRARGFGAVVGTYFRVVTGVGLDRNEGRVEAGREVSDGAGGLYLRPDPADVLLGGGAEDGGGGAGLVNVD